MRFKLFIVGLLIVNKFCAFCQNSGQNLSSNLNEEFYKNCVLISYPSQGNTNFSSGFIISEQVSSNPDKVRLYLVTTRHSLPKEKTFSTLKLRFFRSNYLNPHQRMEISVDITDKKGNYLPKVQLNRNKADVVAIDITKECVEGQVTDFGIPMSYLISKKDLQANGFTVGDEIYTVGYPDGMYDEKNYSPVFRYGIISTLPYENYNFNKRLQEKLAVSSKLDGFLIDANVYPGQSGSLVIFKSINNSVSGVSFGGPKSVPYVLGIVSGSIAFKDTSLNNIQRMGIGIVYSSEAIRETILFGTRLADE